MSRQRKLFLLFFKLSGYYRSGLIQYMHLEWPEPNIALSLMNRKIIESPRLWFLFL